MNQKFSQKNITNKLESLQKIIEKIRHKAVEPDNPEMGDSGYYYDLMVKLKEALGLLEDKKDKKLDDGGEPIVLEIGLCSLLDDGESQKEQANE